MRQTVAMNSGIEVGKFNLQHQFIQLAQLTKTSNITILNDDFIVQLI
jgi:hypothetical protein